MTARIDARVVGAIRVSSTPRRFGTSTRLLYRAIVDIEYRSGEMSLGDVAAPGHWATATSPAAYSEEAKSPLTVDRRTGPEHPYFGPHLSSGTVPGPEGCYNGCGEDRPAMLTTFRLTLRDGTPTPYHWRLCQECLGWANPRNPMEADPLTAA